MKSITLKIGSLIVSSMLLTLSAQAQSSSEFDSFFGKFQRSVMSADSSALQDLMSQSFDYMGTINAAPSEVFKGLRGGGGWNNLQSAVQNKQFISQSYRGKPARFLRCTADSPTNNCFIVFQTDSAGHWRWRAMVMPEK